MKQFLKSISISIIIAFVICLVLDYAISDYLQHTHWRKYDTWTKIVNGEFQDNDLLIFGSSRAWVQYSPTILDSVLGVNSYNMGIDGSSADRQILRWRLYKKFHNKKPKYIIQNIDYVSTLGKTNGYERDQFFPFILNTEFRGEVYNCESLSLAEKYIPMYRYVKYGLYNILTPEPAPSCKGYEGQYWKWDGRKLREIENIPFACDSTGYVIFEEFLTDAIRNDSIKVIFVMSPMYYGVKDKAMQLDKMYQIYGNIANKYDIPILDYTFCEISKDTSNFYNAMHLNKKGAELFSTKLSNDLQAFRLSK